MVHFRAVAILGLFSVVLAACAYAPDLGPVGGPGGNSFDDRSIPAAAELTAINAPRVPLGRELCGHPGTRPIHYIQSDYSPPPGSKGPKHGGGFVCTVRFIFAPTGIGHLLKQGEFVTGIYGRAARFVDELEIITNRSRFRSFDEIELRAYQIDSGGNPFFLLAPPGYKIRQFFGRSGAVVDAIGIMTEEEPTLPKTGLPFYKLGPVGGWEGQAFEDPIVKPSTRVTKISVISGCYVSFVRFEYSDAPPTQHGSPVAPGCVFGFGEGGIIYEDINRQESLDPDEFIRGIRGRAGKYVDRLEFVTNKRVIGPFGTGAGHSFSLEAPPDYEVRRLFGHSGAWLDAIGIIAEKH